MGMRFFDCQPLRKRGDRERMPPPTFQDKEVKFKKGKEEIFREFYFLANCFRGGFSKKVYKKMLLAQYSREGAPTTKKQTFVL